MPLIETGFGKTQLEALLGCKVVKYVHLENCSTNAFEVEIRQTDLKRALESGHYKVVGSCVEKLSRV